MTERARFEYEGSVWLVCDQPGDPRIISLRDEVRLDEVLDEMMSRPGQRNSTYKRFDKLRITVERIE